MKDKRDIFGESFWSGKGLGISEHEVGCVKKLDLEIREKAKAYEPSKKTLQSSV